MATVLGKRELKTDIGNPYLLGATLHHNGCNFALFSKHAISVSLLLFDNFDDSEPVSTIIFDNKTNKTGDVWHVFIYDMHQGQSYGYIVDGPYWVNKGHRFNVNKLLQDPYAKAISGGYDWNDKASFGYEVGSKNGDMSFSKEKNFGIMPKSVIINSSNYDWEGDKPLNIPMRDTIIYEMHVKAFTYDKSSKVEYPGSYLGIIEKIPYLKDLGITTVELLPIQEFNDEENIKMNPVTKEKLKQFWGYSTLGFFAPNSFYSTHKNDGITAINEFKTMVKALHRAGIEVIMDVVYNHTGEGSEYGPTISFKGLDNSIYYMLDKGRYYKNYSGCGNTLNCNHPVVKQLILDSLRYWVVDMHIDGFRFDLAAILGRDNKGLWVPNYSILSDISHDPILSNTKIIAEGWDAAGLYKVGGFPDRWAEWNGKFRDDVRSFIKGDNAKTGDLARRLSGSADLFHYGERTTHHSINFITAHDGFTLHDLVSYNNKHNEQNCEGNMDGDNNNLSWNCGIEGETDDPDINKLRDQQMRNLFTLLLISLGTPMIFAGDEMGFSKQGNNNTYCHDNELNWLNWDLLNTNKSFFDFCKHMIAFRKANPAIRCESFLTGIDSTGNKIPDISWHGIDIGKPDWGFDSHAFAFMLDGSRGDIKSNLANNNIYVAINAFWDDLDFHICEPGKRKMWYKSCDTSENPGFYPEGKEKRIDTSLITVKSRSIVILIDK